MQTVLPADRLLAEADCVTWTSYLCYGPATWSKTTGCSALGCLPLELGRHSYFSVYSRFIQQRQQALDRCAGFGTGDAVTQLMCRS